MKQTLLEEVAHGVSSDLGRLLLGVGSGEESGRAVAVKRKKEIFLKKEFFFSLPSPRTKKIKRTLNRPDRS